MPDLISQLPHDTTVITIPVDAQALPGIVVLHLVPTHVTLKKGDPGIDVSQHQDVIDWPKVKAAGKLFSGIRATKGSTDRDAAFTYNWRNAKQAGVLRMAYHYFANTLGALEQLDNFLETLDGDLGELPPVLDVEPLANQVIDKVSNSNNIRLWLSECERRTDKRPIIYTNRWAWQACTLGADWAADYPLWLAQYNNMPAPTVPPPWKSCAVWQHSATGKVDGIAGNVDLDRWGVY